MKLENAQAAFLWGTSAEADASASVEQPSFRLCNSDFGFKPVVQEFLAPGAERVRTLKRHGRAVANVFEDDDAEYCMIAGLLPADLNASREEQAASMFRELDAVLSEAGFTFFNVVRTWFYVDRVCEWYGAFNAARSAFFDAHKVFETFLPASTGIGSANCDGAALTAGAIAMKPKRDGVRAEIVESPLQAPAMAYKSSFSRAAEIVTPTARQLFISGTASILPNSHEVAFVGDIEKQVECTMRVVKAILESRGYGWKDATRAIVYLKRPEFRDAWRSWCRSNGLPGDFAAETVCDVCRDEWLFEIELDAAFGVRKI